DEERGEKPGTAADGTGAKADGGRRLGAFATVKVETPRTRLGAFASRTGEDDDAERPDTAGDGDADAAEARAPRTAARAGGRRARGLRRRDGPRRGRARGRRGAETREARGEAAREGGERGRRPARRGRGEAPGRLLVPGVARPDRGDLRTARRGGRLRGGGGRAGRRPHPAPARVADPAGRRALGGTRRRAR